LFSSLLYWEACQKLVELFRQIDNQQNMKDFKDQAYMIEVNLENLWNEKDGMFLAASIDCRQVDIWGNAYAIYIGFPLFEKKNRIVDYLTHNFDKYVMNGQIRHLSRPEHWQRTLIPVEPETYQNGAYWGTASGWVAFSLWEKHSQLSRRILTDLIADFQKNGVYECINSGYFKIKNYVVSVVNPLGTINKINCCLKKS